MSLVTSIKDYVDVARNSGVEQLDGYSLAYHTVVFLFTVVKETVLYCVTFHWIRDFSYFCLTPPLLISSFTNVIGNGIDTEAYNSDQPLSHLLAFSETNSSAGVGILFYGFLNGCFSCMHLSAAHLVTIRRMLVQGLPAGICSALGTAVGQCGFLACVLFGFRGLLFPWLALEPLGYILGTVILLGIASAMAQDRRTATLLWSAKSPLFIYTFTSAALAWCEQSAIFQWAGNLSFGAEPTFLETVPSNGNIQQLVQNGSYLVFFFLGSVIGGCVIGFVLQRFFEFVLRRNGIAVYYGLIKQANLPLATLVFAFGFGSMPYYGFDYLLTKGLGFLPQEELFHQTLFSPINLVSKTSQAKDPSQGRLEDQLALLFTLEGERNKSFTIDATPFDSGEYLKANQKRPQTFEDLNYRGEHLWTNRLARISNIKEQANQTQSSFLGPVFSWMRSFLWGDAPTANSSAPSSTPFIQPSSERDSERAELTLPAEPTAYGNSVANGTQSQVTGAHRLPTDTEFQGIVGANEVGKGVDREEIDNYLKEFDRQFDKGFSTFYQADPPSLIEVEDQWQEKKIKEKCYTNPIYKFLLNAEIDAFLGRQPTSHWLSPQEEALLLKRRQLLGKYYDTLALTDQVASSKTLEKLVPKSYANSIYNHQFKGTLKIARRLFSVRGEEPSLQVNKVESPLPGGSLAELQPGFTLKKEVAQNRVLKFDQPLFSKEKKNAEEIVDGVNRTLFHEELIVDHMSDSDTEGKEPAAVASHFKARVHSPQKTFSLEQAEPTPLYAGWDSQLRKLIVTNRFENRSVAGYTFSDELLTDTQKRNLERGYTKRGLSNPTKDDNDKTTTFTAWPIPNPLRNIKSSQMDGNAGRRTAATLSTPVQSTLSVPTGAELVDTGKTHSRRESAQPGDSTAHVSPEDSSTRDGLSGFSPESIEMSWNANGVGREASQELTDFAEGDFRAC